MKLFFSFLYILFYSNITSQLNFDLKSMMDTKFFSFENKKIFLKGNEIIISDSSSIIYSNSINGKKDFILSDSKKYLLLINYNFVQSKENYFITLFVFNEELKLVYEKKLLSFFDLPHPLFSVNDNGLIASFNPIDFSVQIISSSILKEIKLKKIDELIYEKNSFLSLTNDNLFIVASIKQRHYENSLPNVFLFKIDLNDFSIKEHEIELSTINFFVKNNNQLFLSGIKNRSDELSDKLTFVFNSNLKLEKKIDGNISGVLKNENNYFMFDKNILANYDAKLIEKYSLQLANTERILLAFEIEKEKFLVSQLNSNINIYKIVSETKFDLKKIKLFDNVDFIFKTILNDNQIFLYSYNKTFVINY